MAPPAAYLTKEIKACRVCGSPHLTDLFSLGHQYVSNFVPRRAISTGMKCPIDLVLCTCCSLVQLRHTAPQELLYAGNYWYRSGTTATMRAALRDVTEAAERVAQLKPGDTVLDIGSNDGTLLRSYQAPGLTKVGVEPASNFAKSGAEGLDIFIQDFWPLTNMEYDFFHARRAKVVTACGMFYDLEDPNKFVAEISRVLDKEGILIAQLMCLSNMIALNDVGNFAHEHLEFYSMASLEYLFDQHGLVIFDLETNEVNGQSTRLYICHRGAKYFTEQSRAKLDGRLRLETRLEDPAFYAEFFRDMEENRNLCVDFIKREREKGKRFWVYGASTKGNTILQWYGLDHTLIDAAAERSDSKLGLFTVGTGIPIRSEDDMRVAKPDYALVLPYAFIDEFVTREREWLNNGGKFLVPLPRPYTIELEDDKVLRMCVATGEFL